MADAATMVQNWLGDRMSQAWGILVGALWWVVDSSLSSAFAAVWTLVGLDLLSRLIALAVQSRGFVSAIRTGAIRSDIAFRKTFIKILGYFTLMAVAGLARFMALMPSADVLRPVVYGFLFVVEAISITENLVAAGLTQLKPLLVRLEQRVDEPLGTQNASERSDQ